MMIVMDRKIKDMYNAGLSTQVIATRLGFRSHVSILNRLNSLGIARRQCSTFMVGKRNALKHSCDERFFHKIDTEVKAYLLGLLISDGWICKSKGYRVGFSSVDLQLVSFFKKYLKATNPIPFYNNKGWQILISSKRMVDDLERYGCIERKSLTSQWPEIPNRLHHHFARGLFDGDGGIWFDKRGNARFTICGSKDVTKKLALLFNTKILSHGKIWRICISGNHKVLRAKRYLYKNAKVYLDRKRDIFDLIRTKYRKDA